MNKLISGDKLTMIKELCKMYFDADCSDDDFFGNDYVKSLVDQLATQDEVMLAREGFVDVTEELLNSK